MPYIRDWQGLPDALKSVASKDSSDDDAKRDICNAIADQKIKIRLSLRRHTSKLMTSRGRWLTNEEVEIPSPLEPEDFDFENSRPIKPWAVRREKIPHLAGYWHIERIELSKSDVEKLLISSAGSSSAASIPHQPASGPHRKSQTAREGAHRAIREVYPGGVVPDQAAEPNATWCRRVGAKLKQLGLPDVSDDTILRAAGRRR